VDSTSLRARTCTIQSKPATNILQDGPYTIPLYVNNARMSIAIVRANHLCLRSRLSNPNWSDEPSSTVGGQRRPQPFPPLRPAHVALALSLLAKTVQMHSAIFQSPMTRLPSRGWTPSTHLIRSTCILNLLYCKSLPQYCYRPSHSPMLTIEALESQLVE
jgi:hypothetical protein